MKPFRWKEGKHKTGYDIFPMWYDKFTRSMLVLLRYRDGSSIPPHKDIVNEGKLFHVVIVLKKPKAGGKFSCEKASFNFFDRVMGFWASEYEHEVSKCEGTRYCLVFGKIFNC